MMLLRASGIAHVDDVDDAAREVLADEAYRFLLCGHLTLTEWALLEEVERAAFVEAGLRLRLESLVERTMLQGREATS